MDGLCLSVDIAITYKSKQEANIQLISKLAQHLFYYM